MDPAIATPVIAALVIVNTAVLALLGWRVQSQLEKFNSQLSQRIHFLDVQLDRSVQRLERAQYLINEIYKTISFIYFHLDSDLSEDALWKAAELKAQILELRAIVTKTQDQKLIAALQNLDQLQTIDSQAARSRQELAPIRNAVLELRVGVNDLLDKAIEALRN